MATHAHTLWNAIASGQLSALQLAQLDAYLDGLIEWNSKLNLTRIVDRDDAALKHVADALTLLPFVPDKIQTLADVGTGGGVPGAILAVALPTVRVTLIDSTRKKLDAVHSICQSVGLSNVECLHARIESLQGQRQFDVVTSRAVAPMNTLIEWSAPLLHGRGVMLAMKGPKALDELASAKLRGLQATVHPVNQPGLEGHVVVRLSRV